MIIWRIESNPNEEFDTMLKIDPLIVEFGYQSKKLWIFKHSWIITW